MGIVRQMVQQDTPPAAVEKALEGLDEAIRGTIPPIWIEPDNRRRGSCHYDSYEGEIRLSAGSVGVELCPETLVWTVRSAIIHEYCHRLLGPGYGHGGAFLALRLTLSFRTSPINDRPDWWFAELYDMYEPLRLCKMS